MRPAVNSARTVSKAARYAAQNRRAPPRPASAWLRFDNSGPPLDADMMADLLKKMK